jgi:aryl-alcohol dehydrogenase-like predicted oxidoreductase
MEHRRLGSSGLLVSELILGNWATHGAQVDDAAAIATVHAALDTGITTFDTADLYAEGRAEEVLGRALAGTRREGVEIISKAFWPTGPGINEAGLSRKHLVAACEASLRRLGTDHLDVYLAHRFDAATPLDETLRAFDDLVRAGKVLYVGVSEWSAADIRRAVSLADASGRARIVVNEPQYSMLWRVPEPEVVPACAELGVGQIAWSPLAQGVLTGKYLPGEPPPPSSRATDSEGAAYISRWMHDDVLAAVQRLQPLAEGLGLSLAQMSLAWVLSRPTVCGAIIGASRPQQVAENALAVGVVLPADVLAEIDAVLGAVVAYRYQGARDA